MAGPGDRRIAGLLSALAEAPDFDSTASFFLTQLAEIARTPRALLLQFDAARENLNIVASVGFETPPPVVLSIGDIGSPIVVAALTMRAMRGTAHLPHRALAHIVPWIALPLSQPRHRGTIEPMPAHRGAELLTTSSITFLETPERLLGAAPAGVVLIQGTEQNGEGSDALMEALDVVTLASPLLARLMSLEDARETNDRLTQQRDRLTLMVDSLPDPVVIMNAANDIIAQNSRAGRLLHARDDDSPGRRRALELNNLLFTSFLSKTAMMGGPQSGPRELNLVDPDEGYDLLFEVLRTHSERASGRRTRSSPCCATSPTCGARPTSSNGRCSAFGTLRSRCAANATG